jgi:copper(I)-binding protein
VTRSSRNATASRRILIAVAAMVIPLIAGCEAGSNAPSLHWHPPTDGASAAAGGITISNAFVLGAPIGHSLRAGQNAGLFLGLVNTGTPDHLVSVSAPGFAQSVRLPGGRVTLLANHSLLLTGPKPRLVLQDLSRPVAGGTAVTIVLTFAKAGVVTLHVPVVPWASYYTTLSQAPSPAPTSTLTPGKSVSATPSPSTSH